MDDKAGLEVLKDLADLIAARDGAAADTSYTASLLAGGMETCAQKVGEEAVEFAIAAVAGKREAATAEAADLVYHLLVALHAADISLDDVLGELARRQGTSGHAEKAARVATGER